MARFIHYEPCPKCVEKGRDGRGDNLARYDDGGAHCFSCGYHIFPKHYIPHSKERERVNEQVLPADFTREVPQFALQWLLQWGLPLSYWKPFIGWSEKHSRLVFTVGDGPSFSQGRYIPSPLAVAPDRQHRKWRVWGECHKAPHILGNYQEAERVVLVEDIISGHKVGMAGFPTIALFGTKIFDACIPALRHIALPVVVWLDKDQEHTMPKKCNWLSVVTGLPVNYQVTHADPKALSLQNVKEIINGIY